MRTVDVRIAHLHSTPMAYYVVISEQGPAWIDFLPMRDQEDWAGHATFMNALTADGFVYLGGPISDGSRHRARLIVRSSTEQEVRDRLTRDPWAKLGLLTIESIEKWDVLLSNEPDDAAGGKPNASPDLDCRHSLC